MIKVVDQQKGVVEFNDLFYVCIYGGFCRGVVLGCWLVVGSVN